MCLLKLVNVLRLFIVKWLEDNRLSKNITKYTRRATLRKYFLLHGKYIQVNIGIYFICKQLCFKDI